MLELSAHHVAGARHARSARAGVRCACGVWTTYIIQVTSVGTRLYGIILPYSEICVSARQQRAVSYISD